MNLDIEQTQYCDERELNDVEEACIFKEGGKLWFKTRPTRDGQNRAVCIYDGRGHGDEGRCVVWYGSHTVTVPREANLEIQW